MLSTADCKNFLESLVEFHAINKNSKWKRVRKYKDGDSILRDFENQDGVEVTIVEFKDELTLKSLNIKSELPENIKQEINFENMALEFFRVLKELNILENFIESNPTSWHPFEQDFINILIDYQKTDNTEYLLKALKDIKESNIMHHRNKISDTLLEVIFNNMFEGLEEEDKKLNFWNTVSYPASKVQYSTENVYPKYITYNGIDICEVTAGGDWEMPVVFYIYWSPKDKCLKGFFPLGKANVYNQITMTAYGSEDDTELELSESKLEEAVDYGQNVIEEDDSALYEKASKNALKELYVKLASEEV